MSTYFNVSCNQVPVHQCITECPEETCSVRDLRKAVIGKKLWDHNSSTYIEELVEMALAEHWQEAINTAEHQTLFDEVEQIQVTYK